MKFYSIKSNLHLLSEEFIKQNIIFIKLNDFYSSYSSHETYLRITSRQGWLDDVFAGCWKDGGLKVGATLKCLNENDLSYLALMGVKFEEVPEDMQRDLSILLEKSSK